MWSNIGATGSNPHQQPPPDPWTGKCGQSASPLSTNSRSLAGWISGYVEESCVMYGPKKK